MSLTSLFNETELAIFKMQAGFTFGDYLLSSDGTVFAVDRESMQLFVGRDLLKSNTHSLRSIASSAAEADGTLWVIFADGSEVRFLPENGQAETMAAELSEFTWCEAPEAPEKEEETGIPEEDNADLNEVLSRLLNTGRSSAIDYLVSDAGMSVRDATEYVNRIEPVMEKDMFEKEDFPEIPGTMSQTAILSVVRTLKPGDRVHVEYKPLLGRLRVFDAEYVSLVIDVASGKYFSLHASAPDYGSLLENVVDELYDNTDITLSITANGYETDFSLKRLKVLKKLGE